MGLKMVGIVYIKAIKIKRERFYKGYNKDIWYKRAILRGGQVANAAPQSFILVR
jgi:hypothetical protein